MASAAPAPLTAMNVITVFGVFSTGLLVAITGSQIRKSAEKKGVKSFLNKATKDHDSTAVKTVRDALALDDQAAIDDLVESYAKLREQLPKIFKMVGQHLIAPICIKAFDLVFA
mmetsp:Transcript_6850/g.12345  ORF Transcript_6850/g.12345 Transcript_6850/m.12345 type:complete len:114 (+) Transcript_6850:138-479(+)|eukprot:CAMPEP_0184694136 /NCGR_PEP_ID=MMETSP0313-20130426/2186_1 /TAXON_ID=2792 /ORGANISM="Porphyridium aerugineum, Strain SAG 1380-2" /LENGTH=113 /DNA_ID=CAMNT_0027152371 /DNA_START=76 /DNA_END=417 /DNA_ORIENTATION=-